MIITRFNLLAAALLVLTGTMVGCYEKVTYSRQFPGMQMTDRQLPPTGVDHSGRIAQSLETDQGNNFDPIGVIMSPFAAAARGIGNVGKSVGEGLSPKDKKDDGDGESGAEGDTKSSSGGNTPAVPQANTGNRNAPSNSGTVSPFDTSPD